MVKVSFSYNRSCFNESDLKWLHFNWYRVYRALSLLIRLEHLHKRSIPVISEGFLGASSGVIKILQLNES